MPTLLIKSPSGSVAELGIEIGVCIVTEYGVLVGVLGAALVAKRLLRLSAEAFAFVLAGLVGAAAKRRRSRTGDGYLARLGGSVRGACFGDLCLTIYRRVVDRYATSVL